LAVELVLVRHGATVVGEGGLVGGQVDPPLSPLGRQQSARLARRLAIEPIDGLFATPFIRTTDTAAPLADAVGREVVVVPELREIHLGEREITIGTPDGHRSLLREVVAAGRWDVAPGAESMTTFAARVARGLDAITEAVSGSGRAVAIMHGGVIAEACRQATGSRPLAFLPALRHASITRLRATRRGLELTTYNDVAHLQPA
jgi:probable phosphoglycerate mutase